MATNFPKSPPKSAETTPKVLYSGEKSVTEKSDTVAVETRMGLPAVHQDHLGFLAELAVALRESRERPGASAEERGRYERWLAHTAALGALLGIESQTGDANLSAAQADLPPALLKELRHRQADQLERQIVAVLAACNGSADLDQILVGLYRGFGLVEKRRVIQNKLWRLVRKDRIAKAQDKRNVFTLKERKGRERRRQRRR
jgi:hypothetical protein